jgi:hypothetical protein
LIAISLTHVWFTFIVTDILVIVAPVGKLTDIVLVTPVALASVITVVPDDVNVPVPVPDIGVIAGALNNTPTPGHVPAEEGEMENADGLA